MKSDQGKIKIHVNICAAEVVMGERGFAEEGRRREGEEGPQGEVGEGRGERWTVEGWAECERDGKRRGRGRGCG